MKAKIIYRLPPRLVARPRVIARSLGALTFVVALALASAPAAAVPPEPPAAPAVGAAQPMGPAPVVPPHVGPEDTAQQPASAPGVQAPVAQPPAAQPPAAASSASPSSALPPASSAPAPAAASALAPTPAPPAVPLRQSVVEPRRLSRPPVLTGRVDDPIWQEAALISDFTQYEPDAGKAATERTEVRIGYDAENLYFGFRCYEKPSGIVASTMTRDGDLTFEDSVQIILDTYHDHANGFLFAVNPIGAKVDGLVRKEGEDVNFYWDGLWEMKTAMDAEGWTAEMVIPFKTLRFPKADSQTWGFNVRRFIARRSEDSFWKPMERGNGYFGRWRISQFGEMRGLVGLNPSGRVAAMPYAVLQNKHDQRTDGWSGNLGGEIKADITPTLTAELTVHTDFAEAESDTQQINLTRNQLQYPEKRAFFLESSNLFYFGDRATGVGLGGLENLRDHFEFFFSRQIGLTPDGLQEVPMLGGGKLTGQQGDLSVGVLNLTTEPFHFIDGSGNRAFQPETNYSVVRLKEGLFDNTSSIGVMGLAKEGTGNHNEGVGVDWDLALTHDLSSGGFVAKTETPGLVGHDTSFLTDLFYKAGLVSAYSEYAEFGNNFNPELGFQSTLGGIHKSESDVTFYLPVDWGVLHRIQILNDFDHVTDANNRLITQYWKSEVGFVGTSGGGTAFITNDDLEVLTAPFNIYKNIFIPPGVYRFRNIFWGMATDYAKPVGVTTWLDWGNFYDGTRLHTLVSVAMHPLRGFQASVNWERADVELKEGRFVTDLITADLTYSFTTKLYVRSLTQWNKLDNFRANVLLDWTYRPASDFYLVYTDVSDLYPADRPLQYSPQLPGRTIIAKIGHRLDF
jgi:hypothetical protein